MTKAEIVIGCLLPIFHRSLQLEVACGGFLDTTEEVQCVAATGLIELGLEIFKPLQHDILLLLRQIIEGNPEASWLLGKEIRVVLDGLYEALLRQKALGQFFDHFSLQTIIKQVEPRPKHVSLQCSHVVLSIQAEYVLGF